MSLGRLEIENAPGTYVSGTRARWLMQSGRARLGANGTLRMLQADGRSARPADREPRARWGAYSNSGTRNASETAWLRGYHMNGDAINRGSERVQK